MRVPLSWLRDFAPFDLDPIELGETFDDLGMVVEGIDRIGEGLDDVVVARVLDVRAHPKADRVRVTEVDAGNGPLQVVCGAPNVAAGQLVAFAPVGAALPDDFEIGRRKVRGEWSEGMICSAKELGLGADGAGIMVLDGDHQLGSPLAAALGIETDAVYDLAIEGNRPDANSIAGVARDAAARLRLPFAIPDVSLIEGLTAVAGLATIEVESPDLCPRFTARVVTGVTVGPSAPLVARRLTLAGMRPISNVVDASNYVMLELGQPTHPYDLDLLPGRGLLVRRARPGEVLVTLDDAERHVTEDDCLICDATGTPVGIGGIMGGASSEISASTTSVLLEAAYFDAMSIARSAKRLGLRTEASARFERGCDPEGIERAAARFFDVLGSGDVAAGMLDLWQRPAPAAPIRLRTARVNAVLGTRLGDVDVRALLAPIGFSATPSPEEGVHEVVPPSFRPDATTEIDLVEELARHHGYSRIPRTVPDSPYVGHLTAYQRGRRHLRYVLVGAGVSEAASSPLLAPGENERAGYTGELIEATDPLAREESVLRASLLPSLLKAIAHNASYRSPDVDLFEIGKVFRVPAGRRGPLPDERELVGVALAGAGGGAAAAKQVLDVVLEGMGRAEARIDAATAPGLHPTRTARVLLGFDVIGHVGEVDPDVSAAFGIEGRVGWLELDLAGLVPTASVYRQAAPLSRHPSSDIDLAFVVNDSVPASAVAASIRQAAGPLLGDLRLFDVYRNDRLGEGVRSLAFRLRLQAPDRTLTDADVAEIRSRCIEAVAAAHDAELRA